MKNNRFIPFYLRHAYLFLIFAPVSVFALDGSGVIGDVFTNFFLWIKQTALPVLAIGVVGLGIGLMWKGKIGLQQFIWFVAGGGLVGGADKVARTIFSVF